LAAYEAAYRIHQQLGLTDQTGSFLLNMGNCHVSLGNHAKAIGLYREAVDWFDQNHDQQGVCVAFLSLGQTYLDLEAIERGRVYLQKSWDLGQALGFLDRQVSAAYSLSESYRMQGDYRKAYQWQRRHMQLEDSLFNQQKDAQMTRLLAEFEAERKDKEIRLLTMEKELTEVRLDQSRRRLWMIGGGALLLGIIASLVAYVWLMTRRRNDVLSEKKCRSGHGASG